MLRTRLYLGLVPLLLLLAAMGGYAILVSRELAGSVQRDLVRHYGDALASQELRTAARLMSSAVAQARGDPLGARRVFEEQRAAFTRTLLAQSTASAGTPRAAAIAELDAAFAMLVEQGQALVAGGGGRLETWQRHEAALYRVLATIERINRTDFEQAQAAAGRASRLVRTTERVLAVALAGAVLLSLFIAWRLAAALLGPIKALTASAAALGEGDWDRAVPVQSRDELGRLALTFNQMAAKLRAYRDAMRERVVRTQRTMEATLTSTPDPLLVIERDGSLAVRNPAAEELFRGVNSARELPPALAGPLAGVLAGGEHYLPTDFGRVVTLRPAGEDRHYLPRILAIGDELAGFRGAALLLQDVTKLRLLDDAKTNLVGTVSHELKTPLTSLRMAVYLLLEQQVGALNPAQRELLEGARADADRLLRILETLLDLARLEAGAVALERASVSVGTLLADVAAETRHRFEAAGQELEIACAAELAEQRLEVDAGRLRHVFVNLLSNASKYSPPGGAITLSAAAEAEGFVRFAVTDRGPGMTAEIAARVFERFFRGPDATRRGAGLGLAIAREIVVAHGGTIGCRSEPGRGAEFFFLLPAPPKSTDTPEENAM